MVIDFPSGLSVAAMTWNQARNDIVSRSVFGSQAIEVSAPNWMVTIDSGPMNESEAGAWKSLVLRLRGRIDQLALWDHARPLPLGTMRGAPELREPLAKGGAVLKIVAAGQSGKTLLSGDWLGIGSGLAQQLFIVTADVTLNAGGEADVSVQSASRAAHAAGSLVVWDKPRGLFRRADSSAGWSNETVMTTGFTLSLIEDTRP